MHIHFKTIRWKNFLSTGQTGTEISLDKYSTRLIVGENGAGKSTLLDAITFALYNKPFRKVNKPQLINSINNKDCVVEVEFEIGTTEYLVRRGMKPNLFEIFKNGENYEKFAKKSRIEEIVEGRTAEITGELFGKIMERATELVGWRDVRQRDGPSFQHKAALVA